MSSDASIEMVLVLHSSDELANFSSLWGVFFDGERWELSRISELDDSIKFPDQLEDEDWSAIAALCLEKDIESVGVSASFDESTHQGMMKTLYAQGLGYQVVGAEVVQEYMSKDEAEDVVKKLSDLGYL